MSIIPVANCLRNPGELFDNVYFSETSLKQTAARVLNKETYHYPFSSLNLSSTITLVIQKNIMASHVLVVFEFNPGTQSVPLINAGWYLDQGWGFIMCRRLQMQYGGSEVLEIDKADLFMRCMNECEEDRKKSAVIQNAGQRSGNNAGALYGLLPPSNGVQAGGGGVFRAVVPIILPHSSCNAFRQLPFDAAILNQSINIRLTLTDASSLWQNANAFNEARTAMTAAMNTLSFGEWVVGQQMMVDPSIASKKDLVSGMGPNSNFQLNYYWKYPQHNQNVFTYPATKDDTNVVQTTTSGGAITLTLTGFRNAALDSLVLWVERVGPFNSQRSLAQSQLPTSPASAGLNTIKMSNITLTYAGTQLYRSESNELCQALDYMINTTDSTYAYTPTIRGAAIDSQLAGTDYRPSYVRIQIAQFSEVMFAGGLMQAAGGLLSNDTLQLTFDITDFFGIATNANVNAITYQLNVEHLYSSSVCVERGTARFAFVNPMGQPQMAFNM